VSYCACKFCFPLRHVVSKSSIVPFVSKKPVFWHSLGWEVGSLVGINLNDRV
jgi:hypothetical protein